jgi:elongation factor G
MDTARPVQIVSILITPKIVGDQTLKEALDCLAIEDRTIRVVNFDSETGRVVLAGVGETHLEVILDRLRGDFNVEAAVSRPEAFLKTVLVGSAIGESKYFKASRGRQQYAHVKLRLTPREHGAGYSFENHLLLNVLPEPLIRAIEEGVETARRFGHPMDDVTVELLDGSYHDVDSSELAFRIAAGQAFFDAVSRGRSVVVEPVMRVDVDVAIKQSSTVVLNLVKRGAQIVSQRIDTTLRTIVAFVRVPQMFGLAATLAETTKSIGTYSIQFDHYQPIPDELNLDDGDRDSLVGAPRKPVVPHRTAAIALPEPDEDDPESGAWPPSLG